MEEHHRQAPEGHHPERGHDPGETLRLVRRARDGDHGAFAELVRLHHGAVYAVVRRMVDGDEAAEELTQDAFVRAYRGLAGFREESRFSTWIHRIAVRLCLDWRTDRRQRVRRTETSLESLSDGGYDPPTAEPAPDEVREMREMERSLARGLDKLGDDHRAAFLLRHQEGHSYEKIAEILKISVANAKVRVHRGREALLESLRERGREV